MPVQGRILGEFRGPKQGLEDPFRLSQKQWRTGLTPLALLDGYGFTKEMRVTDSDDRDDVFGFAA